jgi:hypothetical protein
MAVTWTISTLERNSSDDGVIVAHWVALDSEVVDEETHSGSSYGTCSFTPNTEAEGYTAYADITASQAIGWVKDSIGEEGVTAIEDSIAAQIVESKSPAVVTGTPW